MVAIQYQAIIQPVIFCIKGGEYVEKEIIGFAIGYWITGLLAIRVNIDDKTILIYAGVVGPQGPGFDKIMRMKGLRIIETTITPKDDEPYPGEGGMIVPLAKPQDLLFQRSRGEQGGFGKPEEVDTGEETVKMVIPEPDLTLFYQQGLKKPIPITESPVTRRQNGGSGREKDSIMIYPIGGGVHRSYGLYCCWMIPFFTAYITRPAMDFAPVLVFSLSRMASTVRGLISTISAISLVVFSSHMSFRTVSSFSVRFTSWGAPISGLLVRKPVSNALLVSSLKKNSCS